MIIFYPEIKSCMVYELRQPGAPNANIFLLHILIKALICCLYLTPSNTIISADFSGSKHPMLVATPTPVVSSVSTLFLTVKNSYMASAILKTYLSN